MSNAQQYPVVILGAGLAGICTAIGLKDGYLLVEREARVGGLTRSYSKRGYTFDTTGHWLHLKDEKSKALVDKVMGDGMAVIARVAHIFSNGVFTHYPFQANTFGLPKEIIRECLEGFFRARDAVVAAEARGEQPRPKNFEDWILTYLGDGFAKYFMIPYNQKLWTVHPREISCTWCDKYVPKPRMEDVIKGAVGLSPEALGYNASFRYPKTGGIESLVRALAGQVSGEVRVATWPRKIDWRAKSIEMSDGTTVTYTDLVSTLPLPVLVDLLAGAPEPVVAARKKLRATQVFYANVAARKFKAPGSHWLYIPEYKYSFYRIGNFAGPMPSMAPPGHASLYVETSHLGSIDETRIQGEFVRDLITIGVIDGEDDIVFMDTHNIPCAYVIFDDNHRPAVKTIFSFLADAGIESIGRYGAWTYSAMEDAILAGLHTAARIAAKRSATGVQL